jgi:hypothetical protein
VPETPLLDAGLLGPVRIHFARLVEVDRREDR